MVRVTAYIYKCEVCGHVIKSLSQKQLYYNATQHMLKHNKILNYDEFSKKVAVITGEVKLD